MYSDRSLVLCAPTGSGKTAVFEMAIVRLLTVLDKACINSCKIVYSKWLLNLNYKCSNGQFLVAPNKTIIGNVSYFKHIYHSLDHNCLCLFVHKILLFIFFVLFLQLWKEIFFRRILVQMKYITFFHVRSFSFVSSPEHKVLRVSYCDRPLSVVRRRASSVVRHPSSVVRRASSVNFFT